jgi:CAI-1 autoinducer synthase
MHHPNWFTNAKQPLLSRIASWDPFPFDQPADCTGFLSCHQNDYLRLSSHPEVIEARNEATNTTGSGAMASILYGGDHGFHGQFRSLVAESMQAEDVLLTTAGWTANVGLMECIATPDLPIYMDLNAHASLWDGARLSPGKTIPVRHNRPDMLLNYVKKFGPGVIVVDGYYSTHGSICPLEEYVKISEEYNCLLVLDEAHSFGMCGDKGGGLAVEMGLANRVHLRTVSLAKALGGNGGFIAGSEETMYWLTYRARSVIFSSSPTPSNSAGNAKALEILMREPERAAHAQKMADRFRTRLNQAHIDTGPSKCQIVSLHFKGEDQAMKLYGELKKRGILFSVFLTPAVPAGTSLARFSIYSELKENEIDRMAEQTIDALNLLGLESKYPKK